MGSAATYCAPLAHKLGDVPVPHIKHKEGAVLAGSEEYILVMAHAQLADGCAAALQLLILSSQGKLVRSQAPCICPSKERATACSGSTHLWSLFSKGNSSALSLRRHRTKHGQRAATWLQ